MSFVAVLTPPLGFANFNNFFPTIRTAQVDNFVIIKYVFYITWNLEELNLTVIFLSSQIDTTISSTASQLGFEFKQLCRKFVIVISSIDVISIFIVMRFVGLVSKTCLFGLVFTF